MLSPIIPHITHSLWSQLGNKTKIIDVTWPEANKELLSEETFQLVIQVNGKLRGKIDVDHKLPQKEVEKLAMKNNNVQKYINKLGATPKDIISLNESSSAPK